MKLFKRRHGRYRDYGLIEWVVGGYSSQMLAYAAKKALKRGDLHEYNHCMIALAACDSSHSNDECRIVKHGVRYGDKVTVTLADNPFPRGVPDGD